jgi:hypothetical protein
MTVGVHFETTVGLIQRIEVQANTLATPVEGGP